MDNSTFYYLLISEIDRRGLEKAVDYLKQQGVDIPEEYLQHLSPLGWEHINLTGDYVWNLKQASGFDNLRPLRVKENRYR
ncbi:Transposase for transposon Tn2501 [Planktothrix tepida]|uniref:Tn3 transposase DDE domain-containing protein n=2 Tax=Planktothrix TaxID=54304 RepID=A0A1J1LTP3_9CYAN|nr:Transposase for transposon Tn2501 [Planktothrix pseudagardhii]CAD5982247.1 Transposase for transposon Tn2501 [Planktothrix tepida]CUR35767.1 hypothetical protein PL9214720037 [Planktothrix tepida PCC 9214]